MAIISGGQSAGSPATDLGNHPDQVTTLRNISNEARSQTSARLIAEEHLDQQVDTSTVAIPSRQDHTGPLRIYRPKDCSNAQPLGVVLYFHSGGFLFGDESTDDFTCCRIAANTGLVVVNVIYRHTDTQEHPAQVNDAWGSLQHIRHHADALKLPIDRDLIVMGTSAGCTLGASVVLLELEESQTLQKARPIITGVLLASPWLIHIDNYPMELFKSLEVSAKLQNADTPVIPSPRLDLFSNLLGAHDFTDKLLNIPLLSKEELEAWPRTVLQVAGADPLRNNGLIFASKLENMW